MPRKTRIESSDGLYHIINRGNYRSDIFETDESKASFEKTIFETCEKANWRVYAYVIMRNHYHLAIETPQGNLVSGMQWLQSTFANRFNRFRKEQGHVFQGRYKSLIIEPEMLCHVVNYIHLNPVRASIVTIPNLERYKYCSFAKYQKRPRPNALYCKKWLWDIGRLKDSVKGWRVYREMLMAEESHDEITFEEQRKRMTRGWCIGSMKYKQDLAKQLEATQPRGEQRAEDLRDLNILKWEETLAVCLRKLNKDLHAVEKEKKSAEWKIAIAVYMKEITTASNKWIGEKLNMGPKQSVCRHVSSYKYKKGKKDNMLKQLRKNQQLSA